jgi:hypothetical protein
MAITKMGKGQKRTRKSHLQSDLTECDLSLSLPPILPQASSDMGCAKVAKLEPGSTCGPIRSRCRRGSGGSGNRVSGQAYFLSLARLASACVALSGTRIFGVK